MSKLYIEGGGGSGCEESYELAAYFYARHVDTKRAELPFFFITGDEFMYSSVSSNQIDKIFGK
jgi:hypothetical protein